MAIRSRAKARPTLLRVPTTISALMTANPHSIGRHVSLDQAADLMRRYGIRHLPVLDGGLVAGLLSQRDVYFLEALDSIDPKSVRVEEAMSQVVYSVKPDAPIEDVVTTMADHKYGCALVVEDGVLVGIFTTTDALGWVAKVLRAARKEAA